MGFKFMELDGNPIFAVGRLNYSLTFVINNAHIKGVYVCIPCVYSRAAQSKRPTCTLLIFTLVLRTVVDIDMIYPKEHLAELFTVLYHYYSRNYT